MNILVVDDEILIRNLLKEYLEYENYNVYEAENGLEALKIAKNENIDLIIMDIMMPKLDGYSALKEIKKDKNIPIMVLSARGEEYDKLLGFELGIDDYVTKPFSPKEVIARVKAILNRKNGQINIYQYEDLKVDFLGHQVIISNKEILLTKKEFDLLAYFIKNKDIALSRETLLNQVWGYDFYGDDRTIDTHIKMLRASLGKYRKLIVTVRGMGYKYHE